MDPYEVELRRKIKERIENDQNVSHMSPEAVVTVLSTDTRVPAHKILQTYRIILKEYNIQWQHEDIIHHISEPSFKNVNFEKGKCDIYLAWLYEVKLTSMKYTERSIYNYLTRYARDMIVKTTYRKISYHTNTCYQNVRKWLKRLEARGLIEIQVSGKNGTTFTEIRIISTAELFSRKKEPTYMRFIDKRKIRKNRQSKPRKRTEKGKFVVVQNEQQTVSAFHGVEQ